ncbi:S-layer homology domain-containing protein [Egicoccus sp. AB-alg6-2]|uniref:CAP and S-layer homology domain-containing protein n=1 Tax=Egicoccus sp. AB-alg6-2 TaxID=3242692 RepID=UPI00359E3F9F
MTSTAPATRRTVALVVLLVLLVGWWSPSPAAAAPDRSGHERVAESRLFDRMNLARTDPGSYAQTMPAAPALRWAEDVAEVARDWSDTMARTGVYTANPNASTQVCCAVQVTEIIGQVKGVEGYYTVEAAADHIVTMVMASTGHRNRLMTPQFTQVGAGATIDNAGRLWVSIILREPGPGAPPGTTTYPHPLPAPPPSGGDTGTGGGSGSGGGTGGSTPGTGGGTGGSTPGTGGGTTTDPNDPGGAGTPPPATPPTGGLADLNPPPRAVAAACPASVPRAPFTDVSRPEAVRAVSCLVWWDIAKGTSPTTFAPGREVRRDQMASFLARAIEQSGGSLPTPTRHHYPDVPVDSVHAAAINKLAEAGIVGGRANGTYDPSATISRGQLTQILVRAFEHRAGTPMPEPRYRWFSDVTGTTFARSINQAADAGWTGGFGDGTFRPGQGVQRDQMAIFLTRWLANLIDDGIAAPRR